MISLGMKRVLFSSYFHLAADGAALIHKSKYVVIIAFPFNIISVILLKVST
jgi:uncharacterized membrane protein